MTDQFSLNPYWHHRDKRFMKIMNGLLKIAKNELGRDFSFTKIKKPLWRMRDG